jgi:hypothetical protein
MRGACLLIVLTGCVSDLAVGMSTGSISEPDAEVEPGSVRDAAFDAVVIYTDDASLPVYDAGPQWKLCLAGDCNLSFAGIDRCMDGQPPSCARPHPTEACEFTCDRY